MTIRPGSRFGAYEVISLLGAGGMGEVYRATDTRLKRDVAIKILLAEVEQNTERLARFEREAQILASLNHPNIAAIHGVEQVGHTTALVLEYIDGPTLADRIAKGPIPLDEALAIAKQIADALEAAHEQGIIHRDLKPANIKVPEDGTVKVLDFGLAKALEPASAPSVAVLANSPTITSPAMMTGVGVLLGTAAYMAPEQAKGRPADKRSDIWAFGCVLYEMLTGHHAFAGVDVPDTLANVLKTEPDWAALPASCPPQVRTLLLACLEKNHHTRLPAAPAVRFLLAALPSTAIEGPVARGRRVPSTLLVVASVILALIAGIVGWRLGSEQRRPTTRPVRFSIVRAGAMPTDVPPFRNFVLTPDGSRLIYLSAQGPVFGELYVRRLDSLESVRLRGPVNPQGFFVSPDGQWIGFLTGGGDQRLMKVPVDGGPPLAICRVPGGQLRGAAWGSDDRIVFASGDPSTGLRRVSANGGDFEALTTPDPSQGEQDHLFPTLLPGGRAVLFTITTSTGVANAQIAVLDLRTGRSKVLIRGGSSPEYLNTGHLLYAAAGQLRAVKFDPDRLEVGGEPSTVVDNVRTNANGAALFSTAGDGTLVYVQGGLDEGTAHQVVWVNRDGREEPLGVPGRPYRSVAVSPEGGRVAFSIQGAGIWLWDVARSVLTPLPGTRDSDGSPVWNPNGTAIIFSSQRPDAAGVLAQDVNGGSDARVLFDAGREDARRNVAGVPMISRHDRRLIVATGEQLEVVPLEGGAAPTLLLRAPGAAGGDVSPDGRWLAFQSSETGRLEVHVRPLPNPALGHWQVSTDGGTRPLWSRDGSELFFVDGDNRLNAVRVRPQAGGARTAAEVMFDPPRRISENRYFAGTIERTYDVTNDGRRFLMIKEANADTAAATAMTVVLNWGAELKRRIP